MNTKVLGAIFRRNFTAYFSNPTGYVFICLFILASSFGAFWPPAFFTANLANLEQLNEWFPFIMLFFIPAVTMGVWADERRQGTDELLLTIPANDLDVVLGKYFAAVAIYSVSLLFSMATSVVMLAWMGSPDLGLIGANYLGYWMIGLAMLAIGMVGSFLTSNLTIAFVCGALLNLPLVLTTALVPQMKQYFIQGRYEDFSRGIVSFSSSSYFLLIAAAMLYVSLVLIGRRHWVGGRDGQALLGHYVVRFFAIVAIAVGVVYIADRHDLRADATVAKLNSLSDVTVKQLKQINEVAIKDLAKKHEETEQKLAGKKHDEQELVKLRQQLRQLELQQDRLNSPIEILAYVSRDVPEMFAAKRLDVLSKLREFSNRAGSKLNVTVYEVEPFSELADQARQQYGIEPREMQDSAQGRLSVEQVFLSAVVRSGVKQIVIPFFELGIPAEYELLRSICMVSETNPKTIGVVKTDANLFGGGFDPQRFSPIPAQPIVEELRKQYTVVEVDPNERIVDSSDPEKTKYAALLVAQPSSLTDIQLTNLIAAIRAGVPTAIFEDPLPVFMSEAPGTDQPRRPPQQSPFMMMQQPPSEPKGDVTQLWQALGIRMEQYIFPPEPGEERGFSAKSETAIVWQRYNPYPELQFTDMLDGEWLFAADAADSSEHFHAFNPEDETTSGMYELLFPFPGAFRQLAGASGDLTFKPLVKSSEDSGYTKYSDVADQRRAGDSRRTLKNPTHAEQVLAARIQSADFAQSSDVSSDPKINVIVVSDIDMLHRAFFNIRANPNNELIKFQFQNVPFALNVIDSLAGEPRFIEVRKRREMHGRLTTVEAEVQRTVYDDLSRQIAEAQKKLDDNTAAAIAERKKLVDKANERLQKEKDAGQLGYAQFMAIQNETSLQIDAAEQREALKKVSLQQEFDRNLKQIRSQRKRKTLALENYYKYVAVVAPPLPPLMVGLFVFLYRRSREKEGVAAARLR